MTACIPRLDLTQDILKSLLHYDPKTGLFTWLVTNSNRAKAGSIAGCVVGQHISITIDRRMHRAHVLAWLYMKGVWPDHEIDHEDHNGYNNIWTNLRRATHQQNMMNCRRDRKNNTSGLRGVYWNKKDKRWRAQISVNGTNIHLGNFINKEDASVAYEEMRRELFGEFA